MYVVTLYDEDLEKPVQYRRYSRQKAMDVLEYLFLECEVDPKANVIIPPDHAANIPSVTCWGKGKTEITANFKVDLNF